MPAAYNVLILGASYGSLLAIKLLAAGHTAKLVCLPAEAEANYYCQLAESAVPV